MKSILLLLAFFGFANAQPVDPDLYNQTWYLYEVVDTDTGEIFTVANYQPYAGNPQIDQIAPQVTITEQLTFSGEGICNTFSGTLELDPLGKNFRTTSSTVTSNSCGFFEDQDEPYLIGPFGFVNPEPSLFTIVGPTITTDVDGFQTLTFITQPFIGYTYRNTPVLNTTQFSKSIVTLYPNPVADVLRLQINTNTPDKPDIRLYTATGKLISQKRYTPTHNTLNMVKLPSGIYFLEVSTNNQTETFKVVKR